MGGCCNVKSLFTSFTKTFDKSSSQTRPDKSRVTKVAIESLGFKRHEITFTTQPDVIWFDIVMSKHYQHNVRRHLIKLHPRNHDIKVVRSALQLSFLHCDGGLDKKWTEEYVRRSSHELMHSVAKYVNSVIPVIANVSAALSVRLQLSSPLSFFVHSGEILFVHCSRQSDG